MIASPKVATSLVDVVHWLAKDFKLAVIGVRQAVAAVVAVPAEPSARGALGNRRAKSSV